MYEKKNEKKVDKIDSKSFNIINKSIKNLRILFWSEEARKWSEYLQMKIRFLFSSPSNAF